MSAVSTTDDQLVAPANLAELFDDLRKAGGAVPFTERRRFVRLAADALEVPLDIVLPDNVDVHIVNISKSGVLIDTGARLCPGNALALLVRAHHAREKMRARVVRSELHRLHPTSLFRVALQLSQPLDLLDALTARR